MNNETSACSLWPDILPVVGRGSDWGHHWTTAGQTGLGSPLNNSRSDWGQRRSDYHWTTAGQIVVTTEQQQVRLGSSQVRLPLNNAGQTAVTTEQQQVRLGTPLNNTRSDLFISEQQQDTLWSPLNNSRSDLVIREQQQQVRLGH